MAKYKIKFTNEVTIEAASDAEARRIAQFSAEQGNVGAPDSLKWDVEVISDADSTLGTIDNPTYPPVPEGDPANTDDGHTNTETTTTESAAA